MAKNIIEKGNLSKPLIIHNRTVSVAEEKAKQWGGDSKVVVASSVDDAVARADIIFTCLSNDKAITACIEAAVKGDVKGKLFVDNSTVAPDTTEMLAKTVEAQGGEFVASPGRLWISHFLFFFLIPFLIPLRYLCPLSRSSNPSILPFTFMIIPVLAFTPPVPSSKLKTSLSIMQFLARPPWPKAANSSAS